MQPSVIAILIIILLGLTAAGGLVVYFMTKKDAADKKKNTSDYTPPTDNPPASSGSGTTTGGGDPTTGGGDPTTGYTPGVNLSTDCPMVPCKVGDKCVDNKCVVSKVTWDTCDPPCPEGSTCLSGSCSLAAPPACTDTNPECVKWELEGRCNGEPQMMLNNCKKSCGTCSLSQTEINALVTKRLNVCKDAHTSCPAWASAGECDSNPGYILPNCRTSCSTCNMTEAELAADITRRLSMCKDISGSACVQQLIDDPTCNGNPGYMLKNCKKSCSACSFNTSDSLNNEINRRLALCQDSNTNCAKWKREDQCKANPGYMLQNCKQSCDTCGLTYDQIQEKVRLALLVCENNNTNCNTWAGQGECQANPGYMLRNCKKACTWCGKTNEETNAEIARLGF